MVFLRFFFFFKSKLTEQAEVFLRRFLSLQGAGLCVCLGLCQVRGSVTMWLTKSVTNCSAVHGTS